MTTRMKVACACYAVALLGTLGFGVTYVLRPEFMPYHAEAVGLPWTRVAQPYQVLILNPNADALAPRGGSTDIPL